MRRFARLSLLAIVFLVSACADDQRDAQGEASVDIRAALLVDQILLGLHCGIQRLMDTVVPENGLMVELTG